VITIAAVGFVLWLPDIPAALSVFTAVVIIACPCALTLAAPITLGTAMGILGRRKIYAKNIDVLAALDDIGAVVFDKTGTLTQNKMEFKRISVGGIKYGKSGGSVDGMDSESVR
jgi:Cu+-exporting ATPase